ncbi:MAG: hypothetical protein JNG88_04955 [Phycisphaerales bacterium]|nr:hypothetical protein [Phycisphaerales bacterium]
MPGIQKSNNRPARTIRAFAARFRPVFASRRRATVLLMVVGMLAMLFVIITAYLTLARFERLTLQQVDSRREARRVVDALNDLLRSYVREEITNSDGEVLGNFDATKPYNFENIPGAGASRYLASLEPVFDVEGIDPGDPRYGGLAQNSSYGNLTHFRFPAVTTLGESSANVNTSPYLAQLMWDANEDGSVDINDLGGNSRRPFLDADGDGIPDADFLGMRLGIEIANALAGRSVRVPDSAYFPPQFQAGPLNPTVALWREFERSRKYDVAARVVSHGGMLALDSVGDAGNSSNGFVNVWNRRFVAGMFLQLKSDSGTSLGQLDPSVRTLYDRIASNSSAIEPLLRRRFLLPTWRPIGSNVPFTAPEVMETLETTWPRTFAPTLATAQGIQRQESWQRFSFIRGGSIPTAQTARDWQAYSTAIFKEPQYNAANASTAVYDVRHLMTTVSNSDDLIRFGKVVATDPNVDLKLPAGTTKFDLGLINRAFRADGSYNVDPLSTSNPINGPAIVRRLATYYYEMIRDYQGFPDTGTSASNNDERRREQAYMMSVNTVAASEPSIKLLGGYTDVVYATDAPPGGANPVTYVGYAPQPFITQVIAYNEPGQNTSSYQVALGVEIYNPNDPTDLTNDEHALPMSQYFISINDDYESGVPLSLAAILDDRVRFERPQSNNFLAGRSFAAFAVQTGNNSHFDPVGNGNSIRVPRIMEGASTPMNLRVKLWRKSANGAPFKVDEFTVDIPGGWTANVERYIDTYRDCTAETTDVYGDYGTGIAARWRMVSADTTDVDVRGQAPGTTDLGLPAPSTVQSAPFTPLYVMNRIRDEGDGTAQIPGFRTIHGTRRPTTFPTPGFLLFVPRYSHIGTVDSSTGLPVSGNPVMSQVVEKVWNDPSAGLSLANYPADFGHMPVFDNHSARQTAVIDSHFDDKFAGRIPWGLLVFDYFTTLNVNDPNRDGDTSDRMDPLNIPSRININTAPWSVLAELPVLSPGVLANLDSNMSPAFRDVNAGVLIGNDVNNEPRFLAQDWLKNSVGAQFNDVLRMGTHLAVAAAAYRDRLPYSGDTDGFLPAYASYRDSNSTALYRPYVGPYGSLRAGPPNAPRTGFISVGELMNVRGFDYGFTPTGAGIASPRLLGSETLRNNGGDFFRAVGLLAMLDTQFLTTRSNTFTVYLTIADRANPQASIRSQLTVDRTNVLPRAVYADDGTVSGSRDGFPDFVTTITSNALPQVIGQREIGYANARYDD